MLHRLEERHPLLLAQRGAEEVTEEADVSVERGMRGGQGGSLELGVVEGTCSTAIYSDCS